MNKQDLEEIDAVNKLISENSTISDGSDFTFYLYKDICGIYCNESNALVLGFLQVRNLNNFKFFLRFCGCF